MYLHIGTNVYIRLTRIIGIFDISLLQDQESPDFQPFPIKVRNVHHNLQTEDAKSFILTETNELYLSNVNCRTLNRRWKALERKFP
jgi:hypothetical protein